jgi:tRNA(adenine34) deaminase
MQSSEDEKWMREALMEAAEAEASGDVPVGAVVVLAGRVVGRGRNRRVVNQDPLAHAEVEALRDAAATVRSWRFDEASLYVTLEPCPMCAGAIVQSRVGSLIVGALDARFGAVRSVFQVCDDPRTTHRVRVRSGILADECAGILSEFFKPRRSQ